MMDFTKPLRTIGAHQKVQILHNMGGNHPYPIIGLIDSEVYRWNDRGVGQHGHDLEYAPVQRERFYRVIAGGIIMETRADNGNLKLVFTEGKLTHAEALNHG